MVKNKNKGLPSKAAPNNQNYTLNLSATPNLVERAIGLAIEVPKEWPADMRRAFGSMEKSFLSNPKFRHLSVLPPGSLLTLFTLEPAAQAA